MTTTAARCAEKNNLTAVSGSWKSARRCRVVRHFPQSPFSGLNFRIVDHLGLKLSLMIALSTYGYTVPMQNPANTILEVSLMYAVPRCLHVIAEMGIADALGDDPRTAADLAASTGANADALNRALRLVSAYGIFEPSNDSDGNKGFAHTPASRLLRTDHPQSMRSFVRMIG